jgi:hypothetical protein
MILVYTENYTELVYTENYTELKNTKCRVNDC